MRDSTRVLMDALEKATGMPVLHGKGGFWIKGHGFVTIAKARRMTGVPAPERRVRERVPAWGDYAIIAMMNRPRKAKAPTGGNR